MICPPVLRVNFTQFFRALALLLLITGGGLAARAQITSDVTSGILTITGDATGNSITVTCATGNVKINAADPDTGVAACASLSQIIVDGGDGDDTIDLSGVNMTDFSGLIAPPPGMPATQTTAAEKALMQLYPVCVDGGQGINTIIGAFVATLFVWNALFPGISDFIGQIGFVNAAVMFGSVVADLLHCEQFGFLGLTSIYECYAFALGLGFAMVNIARLIYYGGGGADQFFADAVFLSVVGIVAVTVAFDAAAGKTGGALANEGTLFLRGLATANSVTIDAGLGIDFNGIPITASGVATIDVTGYPSFSDANTSEDDTFTTVSFPGITQVFDGGGSTTTDPGDQLTVDAAGQSATDDGTTIQIGTDAPITYSGIETVSILSALPVELVDFIAVPDGDRVTLNWTTVSETNNVGFAVEHRQGGALFTDVGFVAGAGTSDTPRHYSLALSDLAPGAHFFRLRQVDTDGSFKYSATLEVAVGLTDAYRLTSAHPNPFVQTASFSLSVQATQHVRAEVYDMTGRRVRTLFDGTLAANTTQALRLDGTGLPGGIYAVRIDGVHFATTRMLSLVR